MACGLTGTSTPARAVLSPEQIPLKSWEIVLGLLLLGLTWMICSLAFSTGFLLKQSQDECPEPPQAPGPGENAPAQGRCLGLFLSGVSAQGALPTPLHGCNPWQTHQDLGIMKPVPLSASLWRASLPCLMWVPYEQGWKHLTSCWPRRFTTGEQDPGSLIGSWASRKRLLGWANSVTHGQTRGL